MAADAAATNDSTFDGFDAMKTDHPREDRRADHARHSLETLLGIRGRIAKSGSCLAALAVTSPAAASGWGDVVAVAGFGALIVLSVVAVLGTISVALAESCGLAVDRSYGRRDGTATRETDDEVVSAGRLAEFADSSRDDDPAGHAAGMIPRDIDTTTTNDRREAGRERRVHARQGAGQ